jgi:hypothetical protein
LPSTPQTAAPGHHQARVAGRAEQVGDRARSLDSATWSITGRWFTRSLNM